MTCCETSGVDLLRAGLKTASCSTALVKIVSGVASSYAIAEITTQNLTTQRP